MERAVRTAAKPAVGSADGGRPTAGPFEALLGEAHWSQLPAAVRARFGRRLRAGEVRLYRGAVLETNLPLAGRFLATAARLIGAPLPIADGATGPASVTVTENPELGGEVWSRLYTRAGHLPQAINSAKRLRGPTGLEEFLGPWNWLGLVMRLQLSVEDRALVFSSKGYEVALLGWRFGLPSWLSPGLCRITHRDIAGQSFLFTLTLVHPVFGLVCRQVAEFHDVE
ncbi:MAG: DUF4166 domain-containing protein [Hyphomicrobiaceae bacterium]|nr:DUF4166 domain-containing protein [Hyphomicrobiaceae bacterium]